MVSVRTPVKYLEKNCKIPCRVCQFFLTSLLVTNVLMLLVTNVLMFMFELRVERHCPLAYF